MDTEKKRNIPKWLPSNAQDWHNYAAKYTSSNHQIQVVLKMERHLDLVVVNRAIRMSVDVEPILGCMFVEDRHYPFWKRRDDLDEVKWCSVLECDNPDAAIQSFLEAPLDSEHDPQVLARMVRTEEQDFLCIKVNQSCCDGGGVKEYIKLLAHIYSELEFNFAFCPELNVRGKRDQDGLFLDLGMIDFRSGWNPEIAALQPTWSFPYQDGEPEHPQVEWLRLSREVWDRVTSFVKTKGYTVNDAITTAYFRALYKMIAPNESTPMEIVVNVDLRRYLPNQKADAICNLSGELNIRLAIDPKEDFERSLNKVESVMNDLQGKLPGLHSAVSLELIAEQGFEEALRFFRENRNSALLSQKASPILVNFDVVSDIPLTFGQLSVLEASIVSPAMYSPGFMLGVSIYNQKPTFTVSYYHSTVASKDVKQLLQFIHDDLIGL